MSKKPILTEYEIKQIKTMYNNREVFLPKLIDPLTNQPVGKLLYFPLQGF